MTLGDADGVAVMDPVREVVAVDVAVDVAVPVLAAVTELVGVMAAVDDPVLAAVNELVGVIAAVEDGDADPDGLPVGEGGSCASDTAVISTSVSSAHAVSLKRYAIIIWRNSTARVRRPKCRGDSEVSVHATS